MRNIITTGVASHQATVQKKNPLPSPATWQMLDEDQQRDHLMISRSLSVDQGSALQIALLIFT
jgi:hypothetical protein